MADKKDNIAQWDAMQKQRMEKDLTELQSLIQKHFEQRTVDDASLSELTDRIEKRKLQRTVSELCSEIQSVFSRNEKFEKKIEYKKYTAGFCHTVLTGPNRSKFAKTGRKREYNAIKKKESLKRPRTKENCSKRRKRRKRRSVRWRSITVES